MPTKTLICVKLIDVRDYYNLTTRLTVGECSVLLSNLGYAQLVFDGYRRPSISVMQVLTDDRIRDIPAKRYKVSFHGGPYIGVQFSRNSFRGSFAAMTADKMLRALQAFGSEYVEDAIEDTLRELRPKGP